MVQNNSTREEQDQATISEARYYIRFGNYDLAIATLFKLLNKQISMQIRVTTHKLLCQCYRKTEQYDLALLHINKAISIVSTTQQGKEAIEERAICMMNKGIVYEAQGKNKDALTCYLPAVNALHELFDDCRESHGIIINALLTLGACYEKNGDTELALSTYRNCLEYFHDGAENDRRYQALINTIQDLEDSSKSTEAILLLDE